MLQSATKLLCMMLLSASAGIVPALAAPAATDELDTVVALYRQEGPGIALPEFERLVAQFDAAGQRLEAAIARGYVGECHWRIGDFDLARTHLDAALTVKREFADRREEAKTVNVLGLLEWDLGNYDQAIQNFGLARAAGRDLGDSKLEGAALNNLSLVYDELGNYDVSLAQYQEVLELYSTADFPRGEGDTLGNIGGVHLLLGRYREALQYYERALAISVELKSKPAMSQDHGNIALCHLGLGEIDIALEHFNLAIELAAAAGMRQDEAYWMRGAANALVDKGSYDQGLATFRTALGIYDEVDARVEHLETLHDMGRLYLRLGDAASAESEFRRAIVAAREMDFSRGITLNLLALGDLSLRHDKLEEAATLYEQARRRAADAGEQGHLAKALLRLALAHREQRRLAEAVDEADAALEIARDIDAQPVEAEALYALGELERRSKHAREALARFADAERALPQPGDPDLGWQIHYGKAMALEALGQKEAAVAALIAAVTVIESVLDRLKEDRFRAGYVQDKYQAYVELVRLQLELGRIGDAFTTSERLRARSFAVLTERAGTPMLNDDERRREQELRERIRQLHRALTEEADRSPPQRRQIAMETFSSELLIAEREYQAFLDDHAPQRRMHATALRVPSSSDVQQSLGPGEAVVEYIVGPGGVTAFVLTASNMQATTTTLRRIDLESRVELLRDLIRKPDERWEKPAASLSNVLIEPLEGAGWLDGIEHIYLVPHGILNYLPFAVLQRDKRPGKSLLLDRYALAYLPSAAALFTDHAGSRNPNTLLALAPKRSRLRYAPAEARSLDALFRPNSQLLLGNKATESRFKNLAGDYRIVHLATHGYFNKLNPLFSGLQLEPDNHNDGLLQVHEILGLQLDAELVTLSACETALGSGYFAEVPAGDEFVGLTRAFLSVGSETVMATLWEVDDRSSVQFMIGFYERFHRGEQRHTRSSALTAAQRELRAVREFEHPYFWAPFILVGRAGDRVQDDTEVSEVTL